MIDFSTIKKVNAFYIIGIGGVSMSAIALCLKERGFLVAGTDIEKNNYTVKLTKNGITVNTIHSEKNVIGFEAVVYSSAIKSSCPELQEAKRRKLLILSRGELLSYLLSEYKTVIAVAGTHGKTTTTAMIAEIFSAHKPITAFIGGDSVRFSNFVSAKTDTAIVEACEYQQNFLYLSPTDTIILNVDLDHTDCYPTILSAQIAYKKFSRNTYSFVNGDDKNCKGISSKIKFGKNLANDFYADKIKCSKDNTTFILYKDGKSLGKFTIGVQGEHNAINSLPAIAVALKYEIPLETIKQALANFKGVKRRNEYLGQVSHTRYYADYAHHPKEISTFLKNKLLRKNSLIVFQPHTYSRTKALFNDFILALKLNCPVAIFKTYPARESFDEEGDGYLLYQKLKQTNKNVYYFEDCKTLLDKCKHYKSIYVLGAGDLYDMIKNSINGNKN